MRRWLRLVPVFLMGALAIAYVLARPALRPRIQYLDILEFPAGALLIGVLLWAALAGRPRAPPAPPWRRHEQVVRELPDPALRPDVVALERWLETGEDAAAAADVLARAATYEPARQESLRAQLTEQLAVKASRRKREALLKRHIEGV
ncbi:MAG TPA: hypothetical protein VM582_04450 [Candidatus Thermoplasmatota archaeon]|nr:hypothetical protein [Candidatus Thermoplasmatota archaeon]